MPYHVCGSQQDNSTLCVPINSNAARPAASAAIRRSSAVSGGRRRAGLHRPAPDRSRHLLRRHQQRPFLDKFNRRTGEFKEVGAYPRFFSGEPAKDIRERWQWTFPIIFSHADPNVLYTTSQRLWKTTDGGDTWKAISGDLTRHDPKTLQESGGPITHDMNSPEMYGTVFSVAPGQEGSST